MLLLCIMIIAGMQLEKFDSIETQEALTNGHKVAVIAKALPDQIKAMSLAFVASTVHRCRQAQNSSAGAFVP